MKILCWMILVVRTAKQLKNLVAQRFLKVIPLLLGALLLSSCGNKLEPLSLSGQTMGTDYRIKIIDAKPNQTDQLSKQIKQTLLEVNQIFSNYVPTSEVSRFNQRQSTDFHSQSPDFIELLTQALKISKLSKGAYDISLSPLIELWGFGKRDMHDVIPSALSIKQAKQHVGYQFIQINAQNKTVQKTIPSLALNFSSIAKGYGVDKVALLLDSKGHKNYLVEIGGEMRAAGVNAFKNPWQIAIERPHTSNRSVQKIIGLSNRSLATSGDYHNYFEKNGVRYSHTIDPITGKPITHHLASVTVLASSSALADAWATALSVLGLKAGYKLAVQQQLAVLFISKEGSNFKETLTPQFNKIIQAK